VSEICPIKWVCFSTKIQVEKHDLKSGEQGRHIKLPIGKRNVLESNNHPSIPFFMKKLLRNSNSKVRLVLTCWKGIIVSREEVFWNNFPDAKKPALGSNGKKEVVHENVV